MNADLLVLRVHDEVASLQELQEGEVLPLGALEKVRLAFSNAFPSMSWSDERTGVFWNAQVFSIECVLPHGQDPPLSATLHVRLHPALARGGWYEEDEEELSVLLLGLCDPNEWCLFDVDTGSRFEPDAEIGEDLGGIGAGGDGGGFVF
jgi:hypothetical protein